MNVLNIMAEGRAGVLPAHPYLFSATERAELWLIASVTGSLRWSSKEIAAAWLPLDKHEFDPAEVAIWHFSDYPIAKPWLDDPFNWRETVVPHCEERGDGELDCTRRELWLGLYRDFRANVDATCGPLRAASTEDFDASDPVQLVAG